VDSYLVYRRYEVLYTFTGACKPSNHIIALPFFHFWVLGYTWCTIWYLVSLVLTGWILSPLYIPVCLYEISNNLAIFLTKHCYYSVYLCLPVILLICVLVFSLCFLFSVTQRTLVGNAVEMPLHFNMPPNCTINDTGANILSVKDICDHNASRAHK
jgi:hypothetical protein